MAPQNTAHRVAVGPGSAALGVRPDGGKRGSHRPSHARGRGSGTCDGRRQRQPWDRQTDCGCTSGGTRSSPEEEDQAGTCHLTGEPEDAIATTCGACTGAAKFKGAESRMATPEPGAEGVTELSSVQQEDRARELAGGWGAEPRAHLHAATRCAEPRGRRSAWVTCVFFLKTLFI